MTTLAPSIREDRLSLHEQLFCLVWAPLQKIKPEPRAPISPHWDLWSTCSQRANRELIDCSECREGGASTHTVHECLQKELDLLIVKGECRTGVPMTRLGPIRCLLNKLPPALPKEEKFEFDELTPYSDLSRKLTEPTLGGYQVHQVAQMKFRHWYPGDGHRLWSQYHRVLQPGGKQELCLCRHCMSQVEIEQIRGPSLTTVPLPPKRSPRSRHPLSRRTK